MNTTSPGTSSNKWRHVRSRVAALVCAAVMTFGTIATAPSATAASTSNPCDFAVFIGVRGTGAPAGSASAHGGRVWTSGGMGDQLSVLAGKIGSELYPTYFSSLNYPASATNYSGSVATGSATLINELNYLSTLCGGYGPAVVIAGHSQGAHVISDALGAAQWPNGPTLTAQAKA